MVLLVIVNNVEISLKHDGTAPMNRIQCNP